MKSQLIWSEKVIHEGNSSPPIFSIAYSKDGSHVIAASGPEILIYDALKGELIKRIKAHKDVVTCLTSLSNGGFASGGADNTVIIWSPKYEGVLKYTHNYSIQALEQEPTSGVLVSGTSNDFGLWSAEKTKVDKFKTSHRVLCISWAKDGQHFALGLYNGTISIRSKSGEETVAINRNAPVWAISWTVLQQTEVLTTSDWDQKIAFYNVSGKQVGRDRQLDFDPCTLSHSPNGEFFVIGGSDKKATLWTCEGVKLATIAQLSSWIWSAKIGPGQRYFSVGSQDGTISTYKLTFNTVHALYEEKYAFRQNMCDVVIQHLTTDQKVRIKCRDFIKKIAVYKNILAVQLSDKIMVYESFYDDSGEMHYRMKEKVVKNLECNLLVVTSHHVIVCLATKLQMYRFSGEKEREWDMESTIRYIKVMGGKEEREGILVGLKNGQVFEIFLDNPFPILLLKINNPVQCMDLNMSRTKLAIVDDSNTLSAFDMHSKELIFTEPNANSVAWNNDFNDLLCYSGNGFVNIKVSNFPSHSQKSNGFVVGFKGTRLFSLDIYSMSTIDISLSFSIEQYLERKDYSSAYQIACFGATNQDWHRIAMAALENFDISIAKKSFMKIKELKFFDIIQRMEKDASRTEFPILWAEAHAIAGNYHQAANLLKKAGQTKRAIDMYTDLNMWDEATKLAHDMQYQTTDILRKKAVMQRDKNDILEASKTLIEIGDYSQAIELLGANGVYDQLIDIVRLLTASETRELSQCVQFFKNASQNQYLIETLIKMGDIRHLMTHYIQSNQWEAAFALLETHPQYSTHIYVPYADWLSANNRFVEAQAFYLKAGKRDQAIAVLEKLATQSVLEHNYDDAACYYWHLANETKASSRENNSEELSNSNHLKTLGMYARAYYAYHYVYLYVKEPFTPHLPTSIFSMARYVYALISNGLKIPEISYSLVLYALYKLCNQLKAFHSARFCIEQLLTLYIPQEWRKSIEIDYLTLKFKPDRDPEQVQRTCYSCGHQNPALNPKGDICYHCHEPFVHSFYSFDDLPLEQFYISQSINTEEAERWILTEPIHHFPTLGGLVGDDSIREELQALEKRRNPKDQRAEKQKFSREDLVNLDPTTVYFKKQGDQNEYFRLMVNPTQVKIIQCQHCEEFFLEDEWIYQVLSSKKCSFCRALVEL